ncbi:MAG: extracellular solute-binding protein [Firmicutes bacterium]|jgi:multiple sugar transport system substrate-binding protein|nr:extracellular solute-binding protein [Bacillota bacterium]
MKRMSRFDVACVLSLLLAVSLPVTSATEIEHFLNSGHGIAVEEATREIAALFNSIQDQIEVTVTVSGAYYDKLLTRAAGGVLPDVATAQRWYLEELAPLCTPLDPFVERSPLRRTLVPPAVEQSRIGGDLIQLPLVVQPLITFYNEELFALAGLIDPFALHSKGEWSWDSVVQAAKRIARDSSGDGVLDIWGVNITASSMERSVLFVTQAGEYFFDRSVMPTESRINSPQVAQALSYVHSLIHEHRVMPPEGANSWSGETVFYSGNAGIFFTGPWSIGQAMQYGLEAWNMAPVPQGPVNADTATHVDGLQMMRDVKSPDAVWKWMEFMTADPRAVRIFANKTGRPPATVSNFPTYLAVMQETVGDKHMQSLVDVLMSGAMPLSFVSPVTTRLTKAYEDETRKYFSGQQSLASTTESIHRVWTALLAGQ